MSVWAVTVYVSAPDELNARGNACSPANWLPRMDAVQVSDETPVLNLRMMSTEEDPNG